MSRIMKCLCGLFVTAAGLLLTACGETQDSTSAGYVEGRLTMSAAPYAGRLTAVNVKRGQTVKPGQVLYEIDGQTQAFSYDQSLEKVRAAKSKLNDLLTGERMPMQAEIMAQIEQAKTKIRYAKLQMKRNDELIKTHAIAQQAYDDAQEALLLNVAKLKELKAQLEDARQSGRPAQIRAAGAALKEAQSAAHEAKWELHRHKVIARVGGTVFDVYHRVGERVSMNQSVLSIQAPADTRALFFVPEARLGAVKLGQTVGVSCDGCPAGLQATINYIAPKSAYTPPVIYSRHNQVKLVFRVEAAFAPAVAANMHPGQPIHVNLGSAS